METAFGQMGLEYVPSSANFVLVRVGEGQKIFEQLLRRGIIVRPMGSWGLPEFIRVSVGTPEQVERFLKELAFLTQRAGGV
jgi:histidinol-phosphate aminotransferase